jgi:heat shock protein 4
MAVVGIDIGTQFSVIAQAVRGGVDIILNESSKRLTPTLISFVGNERYLGEQATTQVRTNMANTVNEIKRIIGRKFSEPSVQHDLQTLLNFKARALEHDEIGIDVHYNGAVETFTSTQLLGMYLTKLKEIIQLKNPAVTTADVVLSCPAYFTDAQRAAYRDAASIAGLNCLRVLNEGTATALSYGIYKSARKEFPEGKETKVLFLDMGYGHFTATIAGFTNTSLRILASESDSDVGGRELDVAIAKLFADEFKSKTGVDAWSDRKARLKLLVAAEKAKITITPFGVNVTKVGVECLKDDRDFTSALTLEQLDELAAPYMQRMQAAIQRALAASSTTVAELSAAELVGGGMRPRVVKRRAAEALGFALNEETGHGLSTSMNLDEAVSRGCSLACAMLSPIFRVKPFDIVDMVPFAVRVNWEPTSSAESLPDAMDVEDGGAAADSSCSRVIFNVGDPSPITRRITFRRNHTFEITAEYENLDPSYEGHPRLLGRFAVNIPSDAAEASPPPKIRVDFRHDISGTTSIVKAELLKEIKDEPVVSPQSDGDATMANTAEAKAEDNEGKAATKRYKRVDLAVVPVIPLPGMTKEQLAVSVKHEQQMASQDADIHATHDMRNTLEAYIYNTRDALYGDLDAFASASDKEILNELLGGAEAWLYDNMESDKATFSSKLKELKHLGDPVFSRKFENENRALAGESLISTIEEFRTVINNKEGKHSHLSDIDRDTMRAACSEAETWYRGLQGQQASLELYNNPVLRVADINARKDALVRELKPIANKKVPAPAPVPASAPAAPEASGEAPEPASASDKMDQD